MKIYDFLFYKSFLLAKNSNNFNDVPVLGGLIFVVPCLMFNIFTITLLLQGLEIFDEWVFKKEYKYIFTLTLVLIVLLYYMHKGRYKQIVENYDKKCRSKKQLHPVIVIFLYYVFSFAFLLIAGLFKNNDWIFG